jgi:hypothetical protein
MIKRVRFIHGFNVFDFGTNTVGRAEEKFRHWLDVNPRYKYIETEIVSYPWTFLLTLALRNRFVIKHIVSSAQDGDLLVAHSNGAWIALQAAEDSDKIKNLVLINPALDKRYDIPETVKRADVLHSTGDYAVTAGKLWSRFVNVVNPIRLLSDNAKHGWGEAGRVGYKGNATQVYNYELPKQFGHSGVFKNDQGLEVISTIITYHIFGGFEQKT